MGLKSTQSHSGLYSFTEGINSYSFQPPTVVCSICKRDGHLKDDCPEDFKKIELKPLPPMNDRFRNILDGLCRFCYCTPNTTFITFFQTEFISIPITMLNFTETYFSSLTESACLQTSCHRHILSSRRGSRFSPAWRGSLGRSTMVNFFFSSVDKASLMT